MGTRAPRAATAAARPRAARVAGNRGRATRRPSSLKRKVKTFFAFLALLVLTPVATAVIYFLILFMQVSKGLPAAADLASFKPAVGTEILYSDGSVMAVLQNENRVPVKLKDINKNLLDATIATEDSRFYEHRGVDLHGIARAVWHNVAGGEMKEGASTITQQLARNIDSLGLTREKKLRRKVAEAILAMRLEQTYSKDDILELYLNQINYGHGTYGAEAASRLYFRKHAKDLTLTQAAYLAGIPQRPAYYSHDADAAKKRHDWVLARMVETGKITPEQEQKAKDDPLHLVKHIELRTSRIYGAPYVVNYVMDQLDREFGDDALYSGWKVYTTIQPAIQRVAEQTLREGLHKYGEYANQGALVCMDPHNGYVRALVGGLDFKKNQYNNAVRGLRQPGSCFKPIVYTAAINEGVCDLNKTYHDDGDFEGERPGNTWHPENYGGKSWGTIDVLTALKFSVNRIAVKVACETGLGTVIDYARRMGITTIDPQRDKYPPLALGAASVRPVELAEAYTVFANDGKRATPMIITKVLDENGEVAKEFSPEVTSIGLKPETIEQMNEGLRQVVLSGTGTAAADVPDAHGKTGTTSDNIDAWFSGYTPELVTIIWAADEQVKKTKKGWDVKYLQMPGATGGHVCCPTWRDFMLKAVPIQKAALKSAEPATQPGPEPAGTQHPAPKQTDPRAAQAPNGQAPPGQQPAAAGQPQPGQTPDGQPAAGAQPTTPSAIQARPGGAGTTGVGAAPGTTSPAGTPVTSAPPAGPPAAVAASAPPMPTMAAATPASMRHDRSDLGGRSADAPTRAVAPTVRRADPGDEMVTVRLCAETGMRATEWCPTTLERRMHRRDVPRRCRAHHAPPGE